MLKLLKYLKFKDWLFIFVSLVLVVAQVYLDLKLPDYIKEITLLIGRPNSTVYDILTVGLDMVIIAFLSAIASVFVGFFVAHVATKFSLTLKTKLYDKVLNFSSEEIAKFSLASLITRTTNDTTQIQRFVAMGLQIMMKAPLLATWAIIKILNKSWQWSVVTGISILFILLVISIIIIFALPKFKVVQTLTDDLNQVTRENITGVRVVRAYNAESFQEDKFEKRNAKLTNTNLYINRLMAMTSPLMIIVFNGITLAIYWVGAHIINQASILQRFDLFGDMMIFVSYAMQVIMAFLMMIMLFIMLPRVLVSSNRVNQVLSTKSKIASGSVESVEPKDLVVEFKGVSFKYPHAEDYILKDINLKIFKGQTVAFIGSTGSGKSTLINLVTRFYDVTEGQLFVDGVDIKDYKLESLYSKIGYVPQKSVIFSGSLTSNIAFGDNAKINNELSVKSASDIAQASEFIETMEQGYDSQIAENGTNLSGGQKQRVSIARAVHRNPEIFVFDDSFSALDYKTDHVLRKELKDKTKNATKLIVAQRIGTIKGADQIVVLDNGAIVGVGTHSDLLQNCKVYKEIALSQLSKKELKNE